MWHQQVLGWGKLALAWTEVHSGHTSMLWLDSCLIDELCMSVWGGLCQYASMGHAQVGTNLGLHLSCCPLPNAVQAIYFVLSMVMKILLKSWLMRQSQYIN